MNRTSLLAFSGIFFVAVGNEVPELPGCPRPAGPDYYSIELVGTNRIPGTGAARGRVDVSIPVSSPFSVSLTPDGRYQYDLNISLSRMRQPRGGVLVGWVTDTNLDGVERIGLLDGNFRATGSAVWNKFIVVITLEENDDPTATRWSGPVVFRGMSRSGMMHTMAGHGPFETEPCAVYGF